MENLSTENAMSRVKKIVLGVVIKVLWKNHTNEELLDVNNGDKLQAFTDRVMQKIDIEKYGISNLLNNTALLEQIAKDNTIQILKRDKKSAKLNSITKLQKLDYDLVKKYGLRKHQHGVETKNIPYERRK